MKKLGTAVMFTLFLASTVLSLFFLRRGTLTTPSALLWLLVILGIMARQTLLLVDNERMESFMDFAKLDALIEELKQKT